MVLGLRGIPSVQGGIETHVRMLYPLLARLGCEVTVVQRSPYFPGAARRRRWHRVRLAYVWAPKIIGVETALHTFFGILYAAILRPHILHLHGIGPAFLTPLARLLGLRVVVTHHTFDYRREKWGTLAKTIFSIGERLGMKYATARIAISEDIRAHVRKAYDVDAVVVPNGARVAVKLATTGLISRFGLTSSRYILCVARFESTKRLQDLIDAFERIRAPGWKVALVGGLDRGDSYVKSIIERSRRNPNVVLTDFQTGRALRELYSHAALFVLCSSHEGQPIALLEALGYGLPILASAIPANLAVPLPPSRFFGVGDVQSLAELIESDIVNGTSAEMWQQIQRDVRKRFDWKRSARLTYDVYRETLTQ
jgi:glycosyltransferase involved in cell wall biosynthesis